MINPIEYVRERRNRRHRKRKLWMLTGALVAVAAAALGAWWATRSDSQTVDMEDLPGTGHMSRETAEERA